jgi:L-amino acid N-acyltransferase YncA
MSGQVTIAPATVADAPLVAHIYGEHVIHGTASFEIVAPDVTEMRARIGKVLDAGWPWLVSRDPMGEITGYAYASQLLPRAAYRFACEDSIYIRRDRIGQGIGTALLAALIDAAGASGFRQMVALIAGTEPASVALHARAGFVDSGRWRSVGRKHGHWIDVLHMQRSLGDGDVCVPAAEPG